MTEYLKKHYESNIINLLNDDKSLDEHISFYIE